MSVNNNSTLNNRINDSRTSVIMKRVMEHDEDACYYFKDNNIVGIFLQGSQNYNLDYEGSDVDTKLIITPSLDDIIFNVQPISTTHILENNEHCDWKDIRLYMQTFLKQNPNFIEILFTDFYIINPRYEEDWNTLIQNREAIAHLNPYRAVKVMKGVAMEKYHAMEHQYPSKLEILAKHGYDPKQLHHLLRIEEFMTRYINGEKYKDCLTPCNEEQREYLLDVKRGLYNLSDAKAEADRALNNVIKMADSYCSKVEDENNINTLAVLKEVQYNIMKKSIVNELTNK